MAIVRRINALSTASESAGGHARGQRLGPGASAGRRRDVTLRSLAVAAEYVFIDPRWNHDVAIEAAIRAVEPYARARAATREPGA